MLLMKGSVLGLEEKTKHTFTTDPLNIIFDDFGIL